MKKSIAETGFDRTAFMEAVRKAANPKPFAITVPGLGGCYVKAITAADGSAMADAPEYDKKYENVRNAAIVLCDADGVALFDYKCVADLELLSQQKASVISTILRAANKHNGLSEDELKND